MCSCHSLSVGKVTSVTSIVTQVTQVTKVVVPTEREDLAPEQQSQAADTAAATIIGDHVVTKEDLVNAPLTALSRSESRTF